VLRIAWLGAFGDAVYKSLDALGQTSVEVDLHALRASQFDIAFWDCRPESSINSPLSGFHGLDLPLIAIVDASQTEDSLNALGPVDDCILCEEIGTAQFNWRVQKLVARYRKPISLAGLSHPEMSLFQMVADTAPEWLIIKDLEHRFLLVSESFAQIAGLAPHEIIGKNDLEIGSGAEAVFGNPDIGWPGFWPQDDAAVQSGEPTHEDNPDWRLFSPTARFKKTWRVPLKNAQGDVYALLVSSADVTDEVRTELELRDSELMLELVTAEKRRAEENQRLAEQAINAKNRFLAAASHDLRQPLQAMGLFLELLEQRVISAKETDLVAKLKHSCTSLTVLFDSLLDISRLDAGTIEVSRAHIEIESILKPLRDEFGLLGNKKQLAVTIDQCAEVVNTDAVLLGRILRNLLQNSITYTDQGDIQVRLSATRYGLRVVVSDTGPGIPVAEQSKIFEEFYQLEKNSLKGQQGMGLGLTIVRRLANLLDIHVQLESMEGRGTVFTLMVPLGDRALLPLPKQADDVPLLDGLCVLVIDDDISIRQGMKYMFEAYDCSVLTAGSTAEIQHMINDATVSPDIVIVDYQLAGGVTGDAILKDVRRSLGYQIPAIFITGDTSVERLRDATMIGCPLLHKPVEPDVLLRAVAAQLTSPASVN